MSPLGQSLTEESFSKAGAVYNENAYSIHVYPGILSPALMLWQCQHLVIRSSKKAFV